MLKSCKALLVTCSIIVAVQCVNRAEAQPTRQVPGGVVVTVPDRLIICGEGRGGDRVDLVTREVFVPDGQEVGGALPERVPVSTFLRPEQEVTWIEEWETIEHGEGVFSLRPKRIAKVRIPEEPVPGTVLREEGHRIVAVEGGALIEGVYFPPRMHRNDQFSILHPTWVTLDEGGGYRVHTSPGRAFSYQVGEIRSSWSTVGVEYLIPPETLPFPEHRRRRPEERGGERGPPWTLNINWIGPQQPPPVQNSIDATLGRVKTRMETALAGSIGFNNVNVNAMPLGPTDEDPIAGTAPIVVSVGYGTLRQQLHLVADALGEPNDELLIYDNLPFGSALPVYFDDATPAVPSPVSQVLVDEGLAGHLLLPSGTLPDLIVLNSQRPFNYFPQRRNPMAADLEAVISHETFHALGFNSGLDRPQPSFVVENWDLFRLETAIGPGVSATEFSQTPRNLRPDVAAMYVTNLNFPAREYRASQGIVGPAGTPGDGWQAGHWKETSLVGSWIGVMDPLITANAPAGSGYIAFPDGRALDIMGWFVNPANIPVAAGPATDPNPAAEAMNIPRPTSLAWTPGFGAEWFSVFVFCGTAVQSDASLVFEAIDLASPSVMVPSTATRPGRFHSWSVTAGNLAGFTYSETWTFRTAGCGSDWDGMERSTVRTPARS